MRRSPARRPSRMLGFLSGLLFLGLGVGGALYFRLTPPEPIAASVHEFVASLRRDYPALESFWKLIPAPAESAEVSEPGFETPMAGFGGAAPSEPDVELPSQSEPPVGEGANIRSAAYVVQSKAEPIEQTRAERPAAEPLISPVTEPPVQTVPPTEMAGIDESIQSGDYIAAHRQLSSIYWNKPEWRDSIRSRIDNTSRAIFFSPQPHFMEPYTVQTGDQLQNIAARYLIPWEYLARLNGIDPRRIRPDQKLKVIKGPFSALIDLSDFELTVHAHGYFVRSYQVGIGEQGTTPVGTFTVQNKLVNPTYYGPDGLVVDADDPANPLGERWIDIGDSYGIHGTIDPESIGRAESRGCIRMHNAEVELVYDLLGAGSEVVIRR